MMRKPLDLTNPLTITLYYLLFGVLWILITDFLAASYLTADQPIIWDIQNFKGIAYVVITAIALLFILRKHKSLIKSQQHDLNMLFTSKDIGLLKADNEANINFISENIANLLGYKSNELIGRNIKDITFPEDYRSDEPIVDQINKGQIDTYHYEKRYLHITGEPIWVEISGMAYLQDGDIQGYVATIQNVMPLRASEQRTTDELIEKKALINSTHDLIWSVDSSFNLVSFNKAFQDLVEDLSSIRPQRGQPGTLDQKIVKNVRDRWEHHYEQGFKNQSLKILEDITIQGSTHTYEISLNPIVADGDVIRISCFGRDVTERLDHIKIIEARNQQLKEIAWSHSHQLRAPLAKIMALVELIKTDEGSLDKDSQSFSYLLDATKELDEIIRKTVAKADVIEDK